MSVRSHAQQDEIKAGKFAGRDGEKLPQCLFVGVRCGRSVRVLGRDAEDVGWRDGNLRQEALFGHAVIAVGIVGGNMAFIAPEEEHAIPGQAGAGVRRDQGVQVFGSRSTGERNCKAAPLRDSAGSGAYEFLGGRLKKILRSGQSTQLHRCTHSTPFRWLLAFAAAHRAAPSSPALSLVTICTGMPSSSGRNLPLSRKARMKSGPVSLGKIFGEMPPPRKIPPVAMALRARLPASAPYTAIQRSSACSARGLA